MRKYLPLLLVLPLFLSCKPRQVTAEPPQATPAYTGITDAIEQALTVIDFRKVCEEPWMGFCYQLRYPQPMPVGRDKAAKFLAQFGWGACCMPHEVCTLPITYRGTYTIRCNRDQTYTYTVPEGMDPKTAPIIGRGTPQ